MISADDYKIGRHYEERKRAKENKRGKGLTLPSGLVFPGEHLVI